MLNRAVKIRILCCCVFAILILVWAFHGKSQEEETAPTEETTTEFEDSCADCPLMDDPLVVSTLRDNYLIPPVSRDVPYNLLDMDDWDTSVGQAGIVRNLLKHTPTGFFIECGAHDGESASNTLMLERRYNWTGLLIEPNPHTFKMLEDKRRKAYLSPTCLSRRTRTEKVTFINQGIGGHIIQNAWEKEPTVDKSEVQCFPLYSFLLALNRTTIDYFSLDVESNELDVLRTIPWDKVNIRVLSVEFFLVHQGKAALREYMEEQGYYVDSEVAIGKTHGADDYIFVKKGTLD